MIKKATKVQANRTQSQRSSLPLPAAAKQPQSQALLDSFTMINDGLCNTIISRLSQKDQARFSQTKQGHYSLVQANFRYKLSQLANLIGHTKNEQELLSLLKNSDYTTMLKEIHTLKLSGDFISLNLLKFLAQNCPNLQRLSLKLRSLDHLNTLFWFEKQLISLSICLNDPFAVKALNNEHSLELFIGTVAKLHRLKHLEVKLFYGCFSSLEEPEINSFEGLLNFETWNQLENIEDLTISSNCKFLFPNKLLNHRLNYLEIYSENLENEDLHSIGNAPNLKYINLYPCKFLTQLSPNFSFANLAAMSVVETQIILPLLNYQKLTYLSCHSRAFSLKESFQPLEMPQLKRLHFVLDWDEAIQLKPSYDFIEKLPPKYALDVLSIESKFFSPGSLFELQLPKNLSALKILVLNGVEVNNSLWPLKYATQLTVLVISHLSGELNLPCDTKFTKLKQIKLKKTNGCIYFLKYSTCLEEISLRHCKIHPFSFKFNRITDVYLEGILFSSKILSCFSKSKQLNSLEISDTCCHKLGNIPCSRLKTFILKQDHFDIDGLQPLVKAKNLERLELCSSKYPLKLPAIRLRNIRHLKLDNVLLHNNQIEKLKLKKSPFLRQLDIYIPLHISKFLPEHDYSYILEEDQKIIFNKNPQIAAKNLETTVFFKEQPY